MTKPYSDYVKPKTRYLLWAISAGRCHFCNKIVWRDWFTKKRGNFAEVAHIIGNRPGGPRGDAILSPEYCNNIENLMLLCPDHHKLVDNEEPDNYPNDLLRKIKSTHEERIEALTEIKKDKTSNVILFGANIGKHEALVNQKETSVAMFREGWYPARLLPVELGLSNSAFKDYEEKFWTIEAENLERQFRNKVQTMIEDGERNHFSIFALAPQPLLIKLGSLLSDIYPAEVYQLHREPPTWEWQAVSDEFKYLIEEPDTVSKIVALNLSLSGTIPDKRISSVFRGEEISIWKLTINGPNNDYLKNLEQLRSFREVFRGLLNRIKARHGEDAVIHIFPAVPVSVAIEIGRIRQPKADLPFVIYDQNRKRGGFMETVRIE